MRNADGARLVGRFGLPIICFIGVAYLLTYMWPLWAVKLSLMASGGMVGFMYFFLGGYGYIRGRGWAGWRPDIDQLPIEITLVAFAAWDLLSPFVLQDFHPVSIAVHVIGALVVMALAGTLALANWRDREAKVDAVGIYRRPPAA